jgi:RNA polymerase sporulation-specific sigma factor
MEDLTRAQQGDEGAFSRLVCEHERVLRALCANVRYPGRDQEDVHQEALLAFHYAVVTYRKRKGPFEGYFRLCVRQRLKTGLTEARRQKYELLNQAKQLSPDTPNPSRVSDHLDLQDTLRQITSTPLSPNQRKVLPYWLVGYNYKEIASLLNLPPKVVDNLIQKVRVKVRDHVAAAAVS